MIPFVDIRSLHSPHREEYQDALARVLDSGVFAGGPEVEAFEADFAGYCGTAHAVAVGSGTEALWLVLLALEIGPGDEVVTVPMTFAATVEAICMTGATPVFADVDERTGNMDPDSFARVITHRTKAVIPVHLFGRIAAMDEIGKIAEESGIVVIEDAAQAHGARLGDRMAGSFGLAGCFSFFPSKNLGALGDAGAVTTDDGGLALRLRALRDHGQERKSLHRWVGWNARMDALQAAFLRIRLSRLDAENRARAELAFLYDRLLADVPGLVRPSVSRDGGHVFHLYVVRCAERNSLCRSLDEAGIGYGFHYPVPVHLQPAYEHLGYRAGDFPVAEQLAEEFLSLPLHPNLDFPSVEETAGVLAAATRPMASA